MAQDAGRNSLRRASAAVPLCAGRTSSLPPTRGTFDTVRSEFHHVEDAGDASFLEWPSTGRTAQGRDFS